MLLTSLKKGEHSHGTAADKAEEGAGHGRSVWSESLGLHAGINARDNGLQLRKEKLILQTLAQYRLWAVTRPHDTGIPSNRSLAHFDEYVPALCTHRPSNHLSRVLAKRPLLGVLSQGLVKRVKS